MTDFMFESCERHNVTPLFCVRVGSFLHGTNTALSDTDYKCVFLPSKESLLLASPTHQWQSNTNNEGKNTNEDVDMSFVSLHQFFKQLAKGEMNAVELAFSPSNKEAVLYTDDRFNVFFENVEKFFNPNALGSFMGCVNSQFNAVKGVPTNRYEWKAVSHTLRVTMEMKELVETGRLTFPLSCREELLRVRGGLTEEELVEFRTNTRNLFEETVRLHNNTVRENHYDRDFVNNFVLSLFA